MSYWWCYFIFQLHRIRTNSELKRGKFHPHVDWIDRLGAALIEFINALKERINSEFINFCHPPELLINVHMIPILKA
jgi:hypothetical protein